MFGENFSMKVKFLLTILEYQLGPLKQIVWIGKLYSNKKDENDKTIKMIKGK